MSGNKYFRDITNFLCLIGIPVLRGALPKNTFLPGLYINEGSIIVDELQLKYPGDILHEAGHIACMAPTKRAKLRGNIGEDMGEEIASHAWSYAAALACNIPPRVVFHDAGYKGSAEWMANHYAEGGTAGVPLLQWFNLTTMPDERLMPPEDEVFADVFPNMRHWLCTMDDPSAYWQSREGGVG